MQIHRIRGKSLEDALQRARRSHGESAVVIGHEIGEDGGVTVAVADQKGGEPAELRTLRERARRDSAEQASAELGLDQLPAGMRDAAERLLAHGCSRRWVADLCRPAPPGATDAEGNELHPLDLVSRRVGAAFRVARLPHAPGHTRVVAFVGSTGVGKTTGLVKLAARLARAERRFALATLDTRRVGAVEQLRAYARLLGAPLRAIKRDARLDAKSLGAAGQDVVLLDTTGRPEHDAPRLGRLRKRLEREEDVQLDTFLVLPATFSAGALEELSAAYGDVAMSGCVVTKLDETGCPGAALEHARTFGLPVAFLSDGQDLGRSFHRPRPDDFADLLLRGRRS